MVMVTSELLVNSESEAVRRSTYVPGWFNVTVVTGFVRLVNVARPGPLTLLQDVVKVPPTGSPSSLAVPFNVTLAMVEATWEIPAGPKAVPSRSPLTAANFVVSKLDPFQ